MPAEEAVTPTQERRDVDVMLADVADMLRDQIADCDMLLNGYADPEEPLPPLADVGERARVHAAKLVIMMTYDAVKDIANLNL